MKLAIIGGGLAGLSLAIGCAREGWDVQLFEKKEYPFHKVCGEYIAMESWDFIAQLGVPLADLNLPRINHLTVSAPNGKKIQQNMQVGGFGISRYTLDNLLAQIAQKEGVQLYENTTVQEVQEQNDFFYLKTSKGNFTADLVAGAYGKRANLDVQLNRKFVEKEKKNAQNYIGIKYHIKIADFDENKIELHNFKNGYCGISKIDNDRYCMCYLTTASNLQIHKNDIKKMEEEILFQNPFLKQYFQKATFLYDKPLAISNISFLPKSNIENNILMLGDAAGMITPLCGNGMSMALHSAKILTDLLTQYHQQQISKQALFAQYQDLWDKNFQTRLKVGRNLQNLFGKKTTTNLAISLLQPFPKIVNKLVSLTHGKPF